MGRSGCRNFAGKPPSDDLWHYPKIIVALKETIRLMEESDEAIPEWPIA